MQSFDISVISLLKDDIIALKRTGASLLSQICSANIEWIIIDGSIEEIQVKNRSYLSFLKDKIPNKFTIKHFDTNKLSIKGIYPCMNFAMTVCQGQNIVFMNSGDEFFNENSIDLLFNAILNLESNNSFVFGNAQVISPSNISWNFPGHRIKNIDLWLKFFEPNHQSMMITRKLAIENSYDVINNVMADGCWKRQIINKADKWFFIKKNVCKFYLGGISSSRPHLKLLYSQLCIKKISITRKIILIIKFLIPPFIYIYYPYIQKIKCLLIEIIL